MKTRSVRRCGRCRCLSRTLSNDPLGFSRARRLTLEPLEERRLLSLGLLDVSPAENSFVAPPDADVVATFDQDVNPATVSDQTLAVHAMQTGRLLDPPNATSASGPTATLNPTRDFHPGELVQVTATTGIESTSGQSLDEPYVWQFRAAVSTGWGTFVDSGQNVENVGMQSRAFSLGDVDGDGDLDAFAATGKTTGNSLFLNDGSGTFTDSGQSLGSSGAQDIALGDVDGDGDLDAFVANTAYLGEANKVWLNNGSGTFTDSGQNLGNSGSSAISLGDLDGDGDLDAFVVNGVQPGEPNKVWFNNGSGVFADSGQNLGGSDGQDVALGDVDNDGDLDAFVANNLNDSKVWLNDGTGTFTDSGQNLGGYSRGVSLGDVDSDGDLDAFVANWMQGNKVWLNNGSGTFTDSGQELGSAESRDVALGDVDGDGDLDAFVANKYPTNKVWLNDGSGTFTDSGQNLGGLDSKGVSLGDLDGDGDLDAFVANWYHQNKVWLNQPPEVIGVEPAANSHTAEVTTDISVTYDQEIDPASVSDQTFVVHAMQTGQLLDPPNTIGVNGATVALDPATDFHPGELVQATATTGIENPAGQGATSPFVWQFRTAVTAGSGLFLDSGQNLGGSHSCGMSLGDMDGDGDLDAFVANYEQANTVWLNDGTGTFADSGQGLGSSESMDIALGDVDGDGDLDAFVANWSQPNKVWLNNGSGTFTDSGQELGSSASRDVTLGDVDGDGDLDAFVADEYPTSKVWLNDGSGTFTDSGQNLGGGGGRSVSLGDLDGDGDLDAFLGTYFANEVWINDGSGTFADSGQNLGNSESVDIALGDVDSDGDLDAFVANSSYEPYDPIANKLWLNDGGGTFTDSGQSLGDSNSWGISLGDVDSDGDLDAFVANCGCPPPDEPDADKVWLNDGSGTFTDSGQNLGSSSSFGVSLGDLDGDGDLDAFVANFDRPNKVWLNFENDPPAAEADGPYDANLGEPLVLDGSGSSDPNEASGDSIVSYDWDIGGGLLVKSGVTPTLSAAEIDALGVGSFPVELTVEDTFGATDTASTTLSIYDNRPFAAFTANPNPAACNQQVTFDGSGSSHGRPDRTIVSYEWDFDDSDGLSFTDASGEIVTHAYPVFGTYVATLRVTDDNSRAKTDTETAVIVVNQGNNPPTADADGPYWANLGELLDLDGSGSVDPDAGCGDSIVSYDWDIGGLMVKSGVTPTLSAAEIDALGVGSLTVVLTVEDTFGATDTDSTTLSIYDNRPFAAFTANPNPAACNQQVTFDGSGSSHGRPDRTIVSYEWDFDDSDGLSFTDASGEIVTHAYPVFGTYVATLRVTDDNSPAKTDTQATTIFVSEGNHAPVADADGPYWANLGELLDLDGSGSVDPNAGCGDSIVSYEWVINGGTVLKSGVTPTLSAAEVDALGMGSFPVELTVEDTFGATDTDSTTLSIYDNTPTASFTANPNPAACNEDVTFDAGSSDHGHPAHTIVSYEWDFDDSDGLSFTDASGEIVTHAYPAFGTYLATLRVTDDNTPAKTDTETAVIVVNQGNNPPVADPNGPYVIDIGDDLQLDGSGSFDPDGACGDSIVSYRWDLDNDAAFDDVVTDQPTFVVPAADLAGLTSDTLLPIHLQVTDSLGAQGTASTTLTIIENQPPTADADGPYEVAEGGTVQLDASGTSDPNQSAETLTYEWDLDGDAIYGETGAAAERGDEVGINPVFSAAGLEGPDSVTVYLRVTDDGGLTGSDTATIDITPVGLALGNVTVTSPINENDVASLSGEIINAGTQATFTLEVDWGDGTAPETFNYAAGTTSFSETHRYLDDDPTGSSSDEYTIELTLTATTPGGEPVWTELSPTGELASARMLHAAVYNAAGNRMMVFGGSGDTSCWLELNDAWVLENADGTGGAPAWTQLTVSGPVPVPRTYADSVYDPASNRLILFGGNYNCGWCYNTLNDLCVLTNADGTGGTPEWIQLSPSGSIPHQRCGHALHYDAAANRMIVFGGNDACDAIFNDAWVLENANGLDASTGLPATPNWIQLSPSGTLPVDHYGFASGYDAVNDRLMIYAGGGAPDNSVWILENAAGLGGTPQWTEVVPNPDPVYGSPVQGIGGSDAVYDPDANQMIVFGGQVPGIGFSNDTWVLENANGLGGTPQWQFLSPTGGLPGVRDLLTAVFDTDSDSMIVFGGRGPGPSLLNDTWILDLSEGSSGSDTASVTVTVNNVAPVVDAGADQAADEGELVSFSGSFTDAGIADTHTIEWDFGDGSAPVSGTLTPTHTYGDDGVFTASLTVSDDDGGVGQDTLTITVENVPPTVDAGPDATVEAGDTFSSSGSFTDPGSDVWTATVDYGDGTGPQPLALEPDKTFDLNHAYAGLDAYTMTVTVEDDEHAESSDTVVVTVVDTTPPEIFCPAHVTVEVGVSTDPVSTGFAAATDNADPTPAVTYGDASTQNADGIADTFDDYNYVITRTWRAEDASGNTCSCAQTITVQDTTPPVFLSVPEDITVEAESPAGTMVTWPPPEASDIADPDLLVECDPPSGSTFPLGTTTVLCTATDDSGNSTQAWFTVTVVDTTPPMLTAPHDIVVEAESPEGTVVTWPPPEVFDIADPDPDVTDDAPLLFPLGTTVVTCTATDAWGNQSSAQFTVTVVDTTAPVLIAPHDIVVEAESPQGTVVTWPPPEATDIADADPLVECDPPSGWTFPLGTTLVTCTATDASGNSTAAQFFVTVVDTTPPVLIAPHDITVEAESPQGTVVTWPPPEVFDVADPDPVVVCNPPSGTQFPLGETVVTCTATDASGNQSQAAFTVTVVDITPPMLIAPGDITVEAESPQGTVVEYEVLVSDNADPDPALVCQPPSSSVFALGVTTVVCTATDASGNQSQATFSVTVVDTTPPMLTAPDDIVVEAVSPQGTVVTWPAPVASDIADPDPLVECDPPSGSTFPLGTTTVLCTATDDSGNQSSASFSVTVVDTIPPTITASVDPAPNAAGWNNSDVTVTFACSDLVGVASCPDPIIVTDEGIHDVEGTAVDNAGNAAMVGVTVRLDKTPPDTTLVSAVDGDAAPVANGGLTSSDSMTFTFTGSDDLAGVAGFDYRLDGGVWSSCTSPLSFTALAFGGHTFQALATDTAGNVDSSPIDFAWAVSQPPIADANGPYIHDQGEPLTLDASASSDPDEPCGDSIVRYEWDIQGDGSYEYDTPQPTLNVPWAELQGLPQPGMPIPITLRVTDTEGATDTDLTELRIYVNEPTAHIAADATLVGCDVPVTFDAGGSSHGHPSHGIVGYEWDFDYDGSFVADATGVSTTHTFLVYGDHAVALRVTDDNVPAKTDLVTVTITVDFQNVPPVADPGGPYFVDQGQGITLDAGGSVDPNEPCDEIVLYEWDLDNDGAFDDATGVSVTLPWEDLQSLMQPGVANPIMLRVSDCFGATDTAATSLTINPVTEVVGRRIFYNNSAFDGNNAAANEQDDDAIATDKVALEPGQTATFANYTSYSRGINAIMVDVENLANPDDLSVDNLPHYFEFQSGNSNDPAGWGAAPAPTGVAVRESPDAPGAKRVTITWPDYAIRNQWLQVTVLADAAYTGLSEPNVFYFGNAVGESGNSDLDAAVNDTDVALARDNPHNFFNPATAACRYDYNRDARVNATDMLIARSNPTDSESALRLIHPQLAPGESPGAKYQDEGALMPASVEEAPASSAIEPDAQLGKWAWLYEFEQISRQSRPSEQHNPAEEAVDKLLASYWP